MWPFARKKNPGQVGGGISFGAQLGAEVQKRPAIKPEKQRQTVADHLDALCAELGARYEIRRPKPFVRIILLELADGDVVSGRGVTMHEALEALKAKVKK
jgi:hypothetical protein